MIFNSPDNYKGPGVKCTRDERSLVMSYRGVDLRALRRFAKVMKDSLWPPRNFASHWWRQNGGSNCLTPTPSQSLCANGFSSPHCWRCSFWDARVFCSHEMIEKERKSQGPNNSIRSSQLVCSLQEAKRNSITGSKCSVTKEQKSLAKQGHIQTQFWGGILLLFPQFGQQYSHDSFLASQQKCSQRFLQACIYQQMVDAKSMPAPMEKHLMNKC